MITRIPAEFYEKAKELLEYDEINGVLTRRSSTGAHKKGSVAGSSLKRDGYHRVGVSVGGVRKQVMSHKLAWFIKESEIPLFIDHKNGVRSDFRWVNLRKCTQDQNNRNRAVNSNNVTGVSGVILTRCKKKFRSQIRYQKKLITLGTFEVFEEAIKARKEAEDKYFGEFKPRNKEQK